MDKDERMKQEIEDLTLIKSQTHMKRDDHKRECEAVMVALQSLTPPALYRLEHAELKLKNKDLNIIIKDLWKSIKNLSAKIKELENKLFLITKIYS